LDCVHISSAGIRESLTVNAKQKTPGCAKGETVALLPGNIQEIYFLVTDAVWKYINITSL